MWVFEEAQNCASGGARLVHKGDSLTGVLLIRYTMWNEVRNELHEVTLIDKARTRWPPLLLFVVKP